MKSYAPSASDEAIENAEETLNLKFADDYREYLSVLGAVWSDIITVSGIIDDEDFGVVNLTSKLRPFYQIPLSFYVIEDVGVDGLVIWQDETGAIYQSIPCQEPPTRIHNNLSDYLEYVIKG
jgi:hypothetical protein